MRTEPGSSIGHRDESASEIIAREELRLASLEREIAEVRSRLQLLRSTAMPNPAHSPAPPRAVFLPVIREDSVQLSPSQKVTLFRSLFRGREDVFPRLWINRKGPKERKGYSPVCKNEWAPRLCEKPKVKCGECRNQAFLCVTDQVIDHHLRGQHVIGVYPLLRDDTCWFLAADFDKTTWVEDVGAFVETCHQAGIRPSVERSRSGNGAHVWFFFEEPIPASTARKMGCYFITQTMARRHQLSMESYDRFFPNQDSMPRGGFGNLIALPLQHGPRQHGNTVFLDDTLVPYADQWDYLSRVLREQRLPPTLVEQIATEASQRDRVIGVRMAPVDEDDDAPWTRPPSGHRSKAEISGPLPETVRCVLSQRLYVDKAGLPSQLLNQIKRLAAFQNPEFYKKQSMRMSTAGTPRVITCAEDLPQFVAIPRGCRDLLVTLLGEHGIRPSLEDQRSEGDTVPLQFHGQLSPTQEQAAAALLADDMGIFVAPPGTGKTVVGAFVIAKRRRNTLILVHRKPLLEQWVAQLSLFLGIAPKEIGQIGGGKRKPSRRVDVAMIQSLVRQGSVSDLVARYGHVVIDECHHLPAVSFEQVLTQSTARYITALTATPYRRDGHQPIIHMQCGPTRFTVKSKNQAAQQPFRHRLICRETSFEATGIDRSTPITDVYAALVGDEQRNRQLVEDVTRSVRAGRSPILLTERRDHLDYFASRLRSVVNHLVILHGGMSAKERRTALATLSTLPDCAERLILATGRYIGEGFDDARLDTLFLAMPVAWKGTLVQYAGRLQRLHPDKTEVRIFDYVDRKVPVLARMFDKRLRGYRSIGYTPDDMPFVEEISDPWDEDSLRGHYDANLSDEDWIE
jgi:superfamily II DNA or RNA helicase